MPIFLSKLSLLSGFQRKAVEAKWRGFESAVSERLREPAAEGALNESSDAY